MFGLRGPEVISLQDSEIADGLRIQGRPKRSLAWHAIGGKGRALNPPSAPIPGRKLAAYSRGRDEACCRRNHPLCTWKLFDASC
ncbi:hypothetical protein MLD38_002207 [Melastoma candidum]|uniref:Uncharacterized protein n=1 Tax=Melastoma candidum TaxID=119954 RepID=A0ACB9SFS4_9MYRT|nr:hypothetical protein MLD38_002207 [Melastoma candidum]